MVWARVEPALIERLERYRKATPYMTQSIAVRQLLERALELAERRRA
jgi:hypothetical protein